jgi:hypothetical protein
MPEIDLAGAGLQRPLVTVSASVLPGFAALLACSAAKLVRLGIKHGIQRLFDSPTNPFAKIVPNSGFIKLWMTQFIGFSLLIGSP